VLAGLVGEWGRVQLEITHLFMSPSHRPALSTTPIASIAQANLSVAGASPSIRRYPDQGHAFVTDVRATRVAGSDAADAWGGFVEFLGKAL
jgi:hypothetical protein